MSYAVLISAVARRAIGDLPANVRARVDRAILALADEPRPHGCVKLAGTSNGWRIRVGDWRVLYTIEDERLVVLVVDVGHRREVYRAL
ncbi:MAG: type II toxin-antitoxin system RelE/ParE family toxin [Tepidisphaerales bacterium]